MSDIGDQAELIAASKALKMELSNRGVDSIFRFKPTLKIERQKDARGWSVVLASCKVPNASRQDELSLEIWSDHWVTEISRRLWVGFVCDSVSTFNALIHRCPKEARPKAKTIDVDQIVHDPNGNMRIEIESQAFRSPILENYNKRGDPAFFGVYELTLKNGEASSPRFDIERAANFIQAVANSLDYPSHGPFKLVRGDGREKILAEIALRRGQPEFRNKLIRAYGGQCAISGCGFVKVLEAAHIAPYRGTATNHPANGVLLRADIHTLFDLGLITINRDYVVGVSRALAGTEYEKFANRKISLPKDMAWRPSRDALRARAVLFE